MCAHCCSVDDALTRPRYNCRKTSLSALRDPIDPRAWGYASPTGCCNLGLCGGLVYLRREGDVSALNDEMPRLEHPSVPHSMELARANAGSIHGHNHDAQGFPVCDRSRAGLTHAGCAHGSATAASSSLEHH